MFSVERRKKYSGGDDEKVDSLNMPNSIDMAFETCK